MEEMIDLQWTGERYVPQLRGNIALEHLHRYAFAAELVEGKRVLDIASGEGYGSEMLARTAAFVTGVDIDEASILHAQKKYQKGNLTFKKGSCTAIPLPDDSVDVVISFETIEHVAEHEKMLSEIKRVLVSDGLLIISTPDKYQYADVPGYHNQFHVKELYKNELESLLRAYFKNQKILGQKIIYGSNILEEAGENYFGGIYEFNKLLAQAEKIKQPFHPIYLIAVCSDAKLPEINFTLCEQVLSEAEAYQSIAHQLIEKETKLKKQENLLLEQNRKIQEQGILLGEKENLINRKNNAIREIEKQFRQQEEAFFEQKKVISEKEKQIQKQKEFISEKEALLEEKERQLVSKDQEGAHQKNLLVQKEKLIHQKDILLHEKEQLLIANSWLVFKIKNTKVLRYNLKLLNFIERIKKVFGNRAVASYLARTNLFDRQWYLEQYPDVARARVDPIWHYVSIGASEGRNPGPLFNTNWYLQKNKDVAEAGVNPLHHYVGIGWKEARTPNEASGALYPFNAKKKSKKFIKKLKHRIKEEIIFFQQKKILRKTICDHINAAKRAKTDNIFSKDRDPKIEQEETSTDVRLIALYLPQYHTIKENNIWWGEGFTEWTNVKRGVPFYKGHYQPHVPHDDIGYYNLEDEAVLEKQAKLAREYGIHGFCFYYYWFGGRRLLEKPIDRLLKSGKPNFPFCFCWANENWTRTWDGGEHQILIGQEHSPENDEAIIRDLIPALKDSRYIKIDGRPLLVVYRPALLPDMKKTVERWRRICREEGVGEIYLTGMRSFELINPFMYGLDAAIQFPPLNVPAHNLKAYSELEVQKIFSGSILSMKQASNHYVKEEVSFPLIRSVCPSWDNTARRMERAASWIGATPTAYYKWLREAIKKTRNSFKERERIIFINAWNEWGEGCHLEPDQKFGYAWLNATRAALKSNNKNQERYFLVISHDAALAGAQILTLNILKEWSKMQGVRFKIICVQGGVLLDDFKKLGITLSLENYKTSQEQDDILKNFITPGIQGIYSSTVVNGPLLARLRYLKVPIITHAHELQKAIERWAPGEIIKATIENSDLILADCPQIFDNFQKNHAVPSQKMKLLLASIPTADRDATYSKKEQESLKQELHLESQDIVVLGCGTTDWRKGTDLFLKIALQSCRLNDRLKFIWIGGNPEKYQQEVKRHQLENRILFLPQQRNSNRYYEVGNIFLLSSREDPCPLVALGAAAAGLPIVCFADTGYIPDFIKSDAGVVVPFEDVDAAVKAIAFLANNPAKRQSFGQVGRERVAKDHNNREAATKILHCFQEESQKKQEPLVSVIVPNYNHVSFLKDRLKTIVKQTYQNIEIIILDDCSSDSSREVIKNFLTEEPRAKAFFNEVNSGSPFVQWKKGIKLASGKYIWIAESDDLAAPRFLSELVRRLESNSSTILAFSQLCMIDKKGKKLGKPEDWLSEFQSQRWNSDYINNGINEIRDYLSKKNTILNASSVVIRSFEGLSEMIDTTMRFCADWLLWVRLLEKGDIVYVAEVLNSWRIDTGNARNRNGMELELLEGPKIISEIGRILKWNTKEIKETQDSFQTRYQKKF